jgi:SAM-dependent methyltransferase
VIRNNRNSVSASRWRAAQSLELDFWKRWTDLPPYRNLDIPRYWRNELARFGEGPECFRGRRVLDVGCGPFGLIHFADGAAERIRIDPLLTQYSQRMPLSGSQLSVSAMAEMLPLADRSIDHAICFNALDHMQDPESALDEITRVLRPGGTAFLMIHTFPGWSRPLFALDRMHPHHYTASAFADLVGRHLRIERIETARRRFSASGWHVFAPSFWKYLVGSLVVSSTYVRAKAG